MYITETKQLEEFVARARRHDLVAVDTEFLREHSYWARLCLIQLGTDDESVVIDPFKVKDLSSLAGLFQDESVVKVFHACSQDIAILYHELGVMPKPLFDTQVAAALLGYTVQAGYATLVQGECEVRLQKADSFTDWSKRPLTRSQVNYALEDVIYLPRVYRRLRSRLQSQGRLAWLEPDFAELVDPARYEVLPEERFRHLKNVAQLYGPQLSCAKQIAAWRERTAMKRDVPRRSVLSDVQVVEICKRDPKTIDQLYLVRGVSSALSLKDAREVLAACKEGRSAPASEHPVLQRPQRLEPQVDAEAALLAALVHRRARENSIAFSVITSNAELTRIARGHLEDAELLRGWRREIAGEDVLALLEGRLSLGIKDGALRISRRRPKKTELSALSDTNS